MSLVFFDLEGTLTDSRRQIPDSTAQAICRLHANNHQVFLCTGCSLAEIPKAIQILPFDGFIASGGASIHLPELVICEWLIDETVLSELLPLLDDGPLDVWLEGPQYVYLPALDTNPFFDRLRKYMNLPGTVFRSWHQGDVKANKMTFWIRNMEKYPPIRALLSRHFDLIERSGGIGEAVPKGINKGCGIEHLIHHFGWENETTYAFGDSENDESMLRKVDHPIAMENGSDSLKKIAEYIALPSEQDGITLALIDYCLI